MSAIVPILLIVCNLAGRAAGEEAKELAARFGNLNGRWRFRTDPSQVGEREGWAAEGLNEDGWQPIIVPGLWEQQGILGERDDKGNPPDGYNGVAWYRLRFIVPAAWKGKQLKLWLGRVDDEDRTFLNGRLVAETGPGIERAVLVNRFYSVKPEFVRFGAENVLAIRAKDWGGPGGIIGPSLSLFPDEFQESMMKKLSQANRPLSERFIDPPADARINRIIHSWPDAPADQDYLIASLLSLGFGGVTSNVSFQDYLVSEEKWQAFLRAVGKAEEAGMSLWLYDERGYPSGSAGGLVLKDHPEWQSHGLLIACADADGGKVSLDVPPGALMFASAYPVRNGHIDTDGAVDLGASIANAKLEWKPPAGKWKVAVVTQDVIYEGTHMSVCLWEHMPFIDYLIPDATRRFIELTHDAYAQRFDGDLGAHFVATFTDEPSLMSLFFRAMPYSVLPWAPNLPAEFKRRRGYDIEPLVPLLIMDAGGAERKARYDYWLTIGEMVSEYFFGQIQERCAKYNIPSGGHLLLEESLTAHVPLYGDFFRCMRRLDAPSMDCLTSVPAQAPWHVARLLSSAAELEGKTITMSETSDHCQRYRPEGDKRPVYHVSEAEIRGTCNRLMLNGINTITSYYSFNGLDDEAMNRLNEWVGRCCTTLRGGRQVTDVALLYPTESLWTRFVPSPRWTDNAKDAHVVEAVYHAAEKNLYAGRRDFTHVDSRTLVEAKCRDGSLVYRDLEWRVVVLPSADTMPIKAWRNLAAFWKSGGIVISIGALPANSESEFPSAEVGSIAEKVFGPGNAARVKTNDAGGVGVFLPRQSEGLLVRILDALLEPDVKLSEAGVPVRATHRSIDGHEIWFLINDSEKPVSCRVSLSASGAGQRLDPATGTIAPQPTAQDIGLELQPYGGMLFRFAERTRPKRIAPDAERLPVTLIAEAARGESLEHAFRLPGGGLARLTCPLSIGPLDACEMRLNAPAEAEYRIAVGARDYAIQPGKPLTVSFSGPEGERKIRLTRNGEDVGTASVRLRARTFFEAGEFTDFFDSLCRRVRGDRSEFVRKGMPIRANPTWVRDHVHEMKAYKFWEADLTSFVDTLIELQHPEGFFYEIIGPADHNHLGFVNRKHRKVEQEENLAWIRLEMEADVEYLMVEAAHTIWQATGDDGAMRRRLPHLERALLYDFTHPTRWDKKHGALKRTFSIDTWDFTYGYPDSNRKIEPGMAMGIMHGDNSGLYRACLQLAEMLESSGDKAKAAEWRKRGAELRDRVNRLCFNGKYYTHQVLLQPVETGVREEDILSLSNPYDINRGLPTHEMAVKIIDEYQARRKARADTHFAEWFSIDPPYPVFGPYKAGQYINGGIAGFVAGELAKAAFNEGRESYGSDILRRVHRKVAQDGGEIRFLYTAEGKDMGGGPRGWCAAAVISALVEGLAGIRDDSTLFARVTISPRFVSSGIDSARVCLRYGPSGAYVALDYAHDAQSRTLRMRLAGTAESVRMRVLLPAGARSATVAAPAGVAAAIETVEGSGYLAFEMPEPLAKGVAEIEVRYGN